MSAVFTITALLMKGSDRVCGQGPLAGGYPSTTPRDMG